MKQTLASTYNINIYIAGDMQTAKEVCREYCLNIGLCVTIQPTDFIYTGGLESGIIVGLINYPRFLAKPSAIWSKAETLAQLLIEQLHQQSATIVGTDKTLWLSRRPTDLEEIDTGTT